MLDKQEFLKSVETVEREAAEVIQAAVDHDALQNARNALLGRKSGKVGSLMRLLPSMDPTERPDAGAAINAAKERIDLLLTERAQALGSADKGEALTDPTMPSRASWVGALHPVTLVARDIESIFRELGFTVALGPEAETRWYNFSALNFPDDHPAMDSQDSLYLSSEVLLRTHTSPVQVRTLQRYGPPVRVLVPGNVYRRDFFDASHAPMFAQLEGLAVDEGISFVDLKATLTRFANLFFGRTATRFRPSFFPFTEPSAEMDVACMLCGGSGCAGCKHTGWMEILGSGMVHPGVLKASGVDPERYTGWAFGMGLARIAMQRYGIPDIRLLYDSDMRFLGQFAR